LRLLVKKRLALAYINAKSAYKSIDEKEDEKALIKKYGSTFTDKLQDQITNKYTDKLNRWFCSCCCKSREEKVRDRDARKKA
jgi:hypothetical protein